ncbi:MAG: addiction module protein [Opitutales bacterium]|nr:addiction module protein [Opitutales bacterium]
MSRSEKLLAMEQLWEDLSRDETALESPAWHADVLRKREEDLRGGRDEFIPLETAKKLLRDQRE